MKRLFATAGVDYEQWKALTVTALKLDLRTSSVGREHVGREGSVWRLLFGQALLYTVFGIGIALLLSVTHDLLFGATVAAGYTIFIVGGAVLLDHSSVLASPDDYAILGFRPIGSRTYFAVRLTNVLAYTTAITTVAIWLPVAALVRGYGYVVGAAGLVGFYACSSSTTLAILLVHATLMRVVGPNALKRAMSYMQLVMSFLVYGGYALLSGRVVAAATTATLPTTPWLLLLPATWFASYPALAAGERGWFEVTAAALSVAAFGTMGAGLSSRLSLDYSERLGGILSAARSAPVMSRRLALGGWFGRGEARAVALLIRAQFRDDQRFRMGVLGIVPMTLVYLSMGVHEGALADPFAPSRDGTMLIAMAVLMFPSMVKLTLAHSEKFRASWIFFACPVDRVHAIRSAKNVIVAWFLLPYLVVVAALYAWFVPNVIHAVVHVALLGLVSHLCLQVLVLMDPEMPFSKPPSRSGRSATLIIFMMVVGGLAAAFGSLSSWLYRSPGSILVAFGAVLAATVAAESLTRARVRRGAQSLEFEG